jgi:hypothetical protein
MRTVKNITVAVSPELYRQTRKLAAEYETTVTAMVAYLLQALPKALKDAHDRASGPKSAPSASQPPASSANPPTPSPEKIAISGCKTVNPNLTPSLSVTCKGKPQAHTAPVSQYANTNQHI